MEFMLGESMASGQQDKQSDQSCQLLPAFVSDEGGADTNRRSRPFLARRELATNTGYSAEFRDVRSVMRPVSRVGACLGRNDGPMDIMGPEIA